MEVDAQGQERDKDKDTPREVTEYMHYRQFFVVWEAPARVVECQALEAPSMNRETRVAWLDDYKVGPPLAFCSMHVLIFGPM